MRPAVHSPTLPPALLPHAHRWAGIRSYIVATWEDKSLRACLAMNLPCLNATAFLPLPLDSDGEAAWRSKNFIPLSWVKPMLARCSAGSGSLNWCRCWREKCGCEGLCAMCSVEGEGEGCRLRSCPYTSAGKAQESGCATA